MSPLKGGDATPSLCLQKLSERSPAGTQPGPCLIRTLSISIACLEILKCTCLSLTAPFSGEVFWSPWSHLFLSFQPQSVTRKTIHYYGLWLLSIAHSRLLARPEPTKIKRDILGLQRAFPTHSKKKGAGRMENDTFSHAEIMLSVLKGFGFPPPHQRVQKQGDDYRSQICISNYQVPFANGPMCAKSNSPVRLMLLSA